MRDSLQTATRAAQAGLFPVGDVLVPSPPAINATSVLATGRRFLPPLDEASLVGAGTGDVLAGFHYGGVGTPTTAALAGMVAGLEGADHAVVTPSGQSAVVALCSALLKPGDHVLVVDTVTFSTRWYLDRRLAASGVVVEYYPPGLDGRIATMLRPSTRLVLLESPGAFTFDMQDVGAVAAAARGRGITTVLDNTWSASVAFPAFDHGVDAVILSLTKYHAGPAGVSAGAVVTRDPNLFRLVRSEAALLGLHVSPDAAERAAQSILTLAVRLAWQRKTTADLMAVLGRLPGSPWVVHPSRSEHPRHAIWQRDYSAANSLVTVAFGSLSPQALAIAVGRLELVGRGYGWGGTVSLAMLFAPDEIRTVSRSDLPGACVRFYFGLEDPDDIARDLERAFAPLRDEEEGLGDETLS